jgi:hypothetical protein
MVSPLDFLTEPDQAIIIQAVCNPDLDRNARFEQA